MESGWKYGYRTVALLFALQGHISGQDAVPSRVDDSVVGSDPVWQTLARFRAALTLTSRRQRSMGLIIPWS